MVDKKIIVGCQRKEQRSFKLLYEATVAYVLTIVRDKIEHADQQKDVVQEIYAKLFLNINKYDENRGAFKFWLRQITLNECRQALRKRNTGLQTVYVAEVQETAEEQELEVIAEWNEERITTLLNQMPEGYRQVFKRVVFYGHSHEEISEELGISTATSRSQLVRSKKWLREYLSRKKAL